MAPTNSEPVYFWKPESENGYLGQWYPSEFTWDRNLDDEDDGVETLKYDNAEQYMMHQKGLLFAPDDPVTHQILSQDSTPPHPAELRSLGRQIPDFDDAVWKKHRYKIVVEGNYLKFTQDPQLKAKLLATRDRELVEASPRDRIWGVGFGAKNAGARRKNWGLNLLGKALMEVRERIRKELLEEEELAIGGSGGGGGGEKAV
ncbi:uncharacterized protein BDCG_03050 [Blastomyces dermatitidis ER-3]|uniref:NADAR domain-containing protein n=2 Tax=Ajellomyces dermatitidis TaxID=5039 RepID=F2TBF0_AJEDA|nr:uncharacterized protein BDCG_03050 [Blastomyces dermatitidis ER-3]EEQ87930.1 hypothetical protein BDCG_03050 [Blastomyces dermatitidis ER-3]EGE80537.1 hypothetical protein BDDG_03478 [Blastomyces dermatitidis ATCC 18188]